MKWPTSAPPAAAELAQMPRPAASSVTYLEPPIPPSEPQRATADRTTELKVDLHQRLIERINLAALETMGREQVGREIGGLVGDMLKEMNHALNLAERKLLVEDILDELLGLGPLEPFLKDPTVSDIMVNTASTIFVERGGKLEQTRVKFADDRHLLRIISKIVSGVGRRVDESSRRWWTPGFRTGAASTRSYRRSPSTGRSSRSGSFPRHRSTWPSWSVWARCLPRRPPC